VPGRPQSFDRRATSPGIGVGEAEHHARQVGSVVGLSPRHGRVVEFERDAVHLHRDRRMAGAGSASVRLCDEIRAAAY
jgi:hypothetical protein